MTIKQFKDYFNVFLSYGPHIPHNSVLKLILNFVEALSILNILSNVKHNFSIPKNYFLPMLRRKKKQLENELFY